eukprot:Nitzschia sp. Nitz4//scaffold170_size48074//43623//44555//NITZ4_007114-RA/size48074-processed-gene-0.27-mRNA-1//-1//CDS//3329538667//3595//frame0
MMALRYAHSNKAGNHADVLKHIVWTQLLKECIKTVGNETLHVFDTHAGNGGYEISIIPRSEKQDAWEYSKGASSGIAKVFKETDTTGLRNAPLPVQNYLSLLQSCKTEGDPSPGVYYPGSPVWTELLLRSQDKHYLFEILEPYFKDLNRCMEDYAVADVSIFCDNGLRETPSKIAQLPDSSEVLCLIDPPFENDQECQEMLMCIDQILSAYPGATIMGWIPVFPTQRPELGAFHRNLWTEYSNSHSLLEATIQVAPSKSMTGSSVVVVNPPQQVYTNLKNSKTLPWLVSLLEEQPGTGSQHLRWNVPNKA